MKNENGGPGFIPPEAAQDLLRSGVVSNQTTEVPMSVAVQFPSCAQGSAEVSVSEVIRLYLEHVELRFKLGAYSKSARLRVVRYLADFSGAFGAQPVSKCRSADLTRWLIDRPTWKSDSTKSDALTSVLVCFKWATRERYIPFMPYVRPSGIPIKPRPRQAFTPVEFVRFMQQARNRPGLRKRPSSTALRCACSFLWRTGARTCEMRTALYRDLDRQKGVLQCRHHKTENVSGEDRIIGLDDRTLRLVKWLERTRKPNGRACHCERAEKDPHQQGEHVFPNGRRGPWTKDTFARLFRTFADRAGIDKRKSAYCLRHGFCVQCIRAGISERAIADQMGHAGTKHIAWYGRQSKQQADHLREVVRRANE